VVQVSCVGRTDGQMQALRRTRIRQDSGTSHALRIILLRRQNKLVSDATAAGEILSNISAESAISALLHF